MSRKPSGAFVKTRKGSCHLTVKVGRDNYNIMCIRNYVLEPQDKCDMRRLYPGYLFNWKKIGQQFAEKRGVCRAYRFKRQAPRSVERISESSVMVSYDPRTRTVYASDICDSMALFDVVLHMERVHKKQSRQAVQSTPDVPCSRLQKMTTGLQSSATASLP